ncbi:hypothetical protein CAEBREN_16288 [Caenorhabditis brenneri]|uniref:Pep3/Vps18 RING C-terminal domain-containing protein n=1 Tax=Caenorhabditis brenneri TaxID=135651 RepID=G0MN80_CAEBE|nr:hypothetical protein CAEBREN_16288 [Caenorhabditis brenneri]
MGLKTLLDKKLERLTAPDDKIRRDALVMWFLNVQLEELAEMRRLKNNNQDTQFADKLKDTTDHVQRYFMRKNVIESIQTNREAVYRMCIAHADFEMQLFFAHAVKDLRTEIDIFMLREQYIEVLDVLKNEKIGELTYEMLPLLIEKIPKQVIVYLIKDIGSFAPVRLLPCLSHCVKTIEMAIPAIKFLEIFFKDSSNHQESHKNFHNIYIHLMAKFRPERLLEYFKSHGTVRSEIPYELDFAMRTCQEFGLDEAIVWLYCVAGMFGDAVEKALNFTAAAEILAQSSEPFESVVLKFLTNSSERKMGLKTLLDKKLERLTAPDDKIRRDALVMWLLNVQLEELAEMRRLKNNNQDTQFADKLKDTTDHVQRYFMRKNVIESIQTNREAVYRMCIAHADFEMQLFFAHAVKDLRTEIDIFMLREQYIEVLDVLKNEKIGELTYEMLPLLIEKIPKQVIVYLIKDIGSFSPARLLPCLSHCVKTIEMAIPAIKFLEIFFKDSSNHQESHKNFHNIYIHLMAKFRPERLLEYFKSHGTVRSEIPYELDFAMRTCQEFGLDEAIVWLYCVAGMFGDAVEKALKIDVELAKQCALMMDEADTNFPWIQEDSTDYIRQKLDQKSKKTIWLKIGQYYIAQDNVEKCIEIINESNHLISIQDLLPIIPKFTKVSDLKSVIVDFLQRNKDRLEKLERSMKEATDIASEIRDKQEKLKNRTTVVKPSDVCAHCARPISGRPFNVHSCRHLFHRECLEIAMTPFLSPEDVLKMKGLIADEERVLCQMKAEQLAGNQKGVQEKQLKYVKVSTAISTIVGTECPLCGDIAISLIDKPFMSDEEFAADLNSWLF